MRVLIALAAAGLAAAAMPSAAGEAPSVTIAKMAFGPAPKGLTAGQSLVFRNADIFRHTATSAGDFDLDLEPGRTGRVKLKRAGTYQVICSYHPNMKLRLEVAAAPTRGTAKGKGR